MRRPSRPGPRSPLAGRQPVTERAGGVNRAADQLPAWRRNVPIANEDRLVEPDRLGTTIKLSFPEGPLAWRQRATASGAGAATSIRGGRRDVPRDPLPLGLLVQRAGSLSLQPAQSRAAGYGM